VERPLFVSHSRHPSLIALLTILFLSFFAFLGIYRMMPPKEVKENASLDDFSAERTLMVLRDFAQDPRPLGSPSHQRAGQSIMMRLSALGLKPFVQNATVVNTRRDNPIRAANITNIMARIRGTHPSQSVLLVAHYDTEPASPGASDDGAGVAVMMETARALLEGPAPANDVIFLFSDAGAAGMMGAKAFVEKHPWAQRIGIVLYLDAWGICGPAFLCRTSQADNRIIHEYARSVSLPMASSLLTFSYNLFPPPESDFVVFKEAGLNGLELAYFSNGIFNRSMIDSTENINPGSLQHLGEKTLTLTRHFGNLQTRMSNEDGLVYFNILGKWLVHYTRNWSYVFTIVMILAGILSLIVGIIKGRLVLHRIVPGFVATTLCLVIVPAAVLLVWKLLQYFHQGDIWYSFNNATVYMFGLGALTVFFTLAVYNWLFRRCTMPNLAAGSILCLMVPGIIVGISYPALSFLFTWPLISACIGMIILFKSRIEQMGTLQHFAILCIFAIPVFLILTPAITMFYLAFGIAGCWLLSLCIVFLLGLIVPHIHLMLPLCKNRCLLLFFALSIGCILSGILLSGFDVHHPRTNTLFYALNADDNHAVWASSDTDLDPWTSLFIKNGVVKSKMPEFFPGCDENCIVGPAVKADVSQPEVRLISEERFDDMRVMRMLITPARRTGILFLNLESHIDVRSTVLNGLEIKPVGFEEDIPSDKKWRLNYWAPPGNGFELTLKIKSEGPVLLRVIQMIYGFPEIPNVSFPPRPTEMMPRPSQITDCTLVTRTFRF